MDLRRHLAAWSGWYRSGRCIPRSEWSVLVSPVQTARLVSRWLLSLIAVQEEFFSSRYLLRPTVCRNVLKIVELVGFDIDHPFGTAPFALFDSLYFLRKRDRSTQCRCGASKQLEQGQEQDADPESVVDLWRTWRAMGEERDDYEGEFCRVLGIVENLLLHVGTD